MIPNLHFPCMEYTHSQNTTPQRSLDACLYTYIRLSNVPKITTLPPERSKHTEMPAQPIVTLLTAGPPETRNSLSTESRETEIIDFSETDTDVTKSLWQPNVKRDFPLRFSSPMTKN